MKNQNDNNLLIKFERYSYKNLLKNYSISSDEFNRRLITNIIYNEKLHIVCCFKEFLIFYDPGEFFADFYDLKDSKNKLKTYSEFYSINSRIFANYILLPESKYIFNNIKKKQKLLDNIEDNNYKYNNENNENEIMNYSDINNAHSLHLNNTQNSYYSTIFTPSIVNSIVNDFDTSIKNETNTSNISKVKFLIDNINKNTKKDGNCTIYKTPKNKNEINNESDNKKKTISSIELFTIDKNKKTNSTKNNKSKNKIMPNYNKEKYLHNILKKNKEKLIDTEISNNDFKKNNKKSKQQNRRKKSKNNIHKKTQSNENIRNDIKIFKDNDTINNKISMLLKTNCEIKSLKNNCYQDNNIKINKNKKNITLQKYIQHMTNVSRGMEKNINEINRTSMKNNKISLKKTTTKTNTAYNNKTKSQTSISYRPKKTSSIAKSMPKLPTSFDNQYKIKNSKNIFHNQIFNFHSNYQSLKNTNYNYNSQIKKSKNKINNRKNSYKINKKVKDKSLNNFYQIIQKNIDNNIKYNIYNIKNNYIINNKTQIKNINKNKKNNIIPSLHISLGNIINNNNTFIKCYSKSLSKSKSKSHSKSRSINKSNSIIKIIDENNKQFQIKGNLNNINQLNIDIAKNIHKSKEGLQTERINNNFKSNKINTIPKISFDVNMNNNINNNKINGYKTTINNKSYLKGIEQKKKNEMKNLHINFKQGSNVHSSYYMNKKIPQSARNKNNINNLNNNKNTNFGSETELQNHHLKPTTHRVFNKFNCQNKLNNKNLLDNQKEILSTKNKNIYLIHNYNINNINNNINFFSQQNIKSTFNKNISSKRNSMNQEQGTNIIININNNIFQNNKNNFNYNNYIYNSSINNNINIGNNIKKNNNKIFVKNNSNSKNIKNTKDNKLK